MHGLVREQIANCAFTVSMDAVGERAEIRVGVVGDDAISSMRGEGRSEARGGRGLTDSTLHGENSNLVVASHRLTHSTDELVVFNFCGRLTGVDGSE